MLNPLATDLALCGLRQVGHVVFPSVFSFVKHLLRYVCPHIKTMGRQFSSLFLGTDGFYHVFMHS